MINPLDSSKTAYTKPVLVEYGSLAERTQIFGLQNPDTLIPDATILTAGIAVTVIG